MKHKNNVARKNKLKTDKKRVTISLDEEMYLNIRSLAITENRTTGQQIQYLIKIAFMAMGAGQEEPQEEEEVPTTEAIGFKMEKHSEEEHEDDE